MLVLYLLVLIGAALVMHRARQHGGRHQGFAWLVGWGLAGALFTFSLLTGLSIGLYVFPAAALAIFWLAASAPGREAIAFPAGSAAVVVAILALN